MKSKLSLSIKGKEHNWSFDVYLDKKYLQDWRNDELEIEEVINTIPLWIVNLKLVRIWCFLQDCFYFKNPFSN